MSPVCPDPSRLRLDPVSYESLRRFRVEPDYAVYSVITFRRTAGGNLGCN